MASTRLVLPNRPPAQHGFPGPASLLVRLASVKNPKGAKEVPETPQETGTANAPAPRGGFYGILEKVFGIDVRSLALFRICLGLIMIGDLLYRAQDLKAHYTDAGVLPIPLVTVYQQQHWWWTIHSLHPALGLEVALFLVAGLFSFSLLVGYRTRTVSVICFLLLISLQNRNILVLTGGDTMLRAMAFWAMFLPLGLRWSVDRALDKTNAPMPQRIFSLATVAVVVQIGVVYFFGAALKTGPTWRTDHTAIYYALSLGQFATPLAKFLLHYPAQLKALTFLAWNLEFLAPFLILASAFSDRLRTAVVLAYMGFHISLGLCLELGLFPTIGALSWLILMPDWFWQMLSRLTARFPRRQALTLPPALAARVAIWRAYLRPQTLSTRTPLAIQCFVGFYLVYMLAWNIRTTNFDLHMRWFPMTWNWIGEIVRMDQSWELFAPDPLKIQSWIVVPATLADGEEVDLKTQLSPVSWTEPSDIASTYYNERWRKYLMNISGGPDQSQCFAYASYLGNLWNADHPYAQHVKKVSIVLMSSTTTLPDTPRAQPDKIELFKGEYP